MTSQFRIPPAPMTGALNRLVAMAATKMFGQVPDGIGVMAHHPKLLRTNLSFERKVATFDEADDTLKVLAVMASAGVVGCSWCLDFGYYLAQEDGVAMDKVREVPRWRDAEVFTDRERRVLDYAEAMTETPVRVTDQMVDDLVADLGTPAVIELTHLIAVENERSRFNVAMGLSSQGFSDFCEIVGPEEREAERA